MNTVAKNLHDLMRQCQINATQLADRTGVQQPNIHRILSGKVKDPRTDTLEPLARFFHVSVAQLRGEIPLQPSAADKVSPVRPDFVTGTVPVISWVQAGKLDPVADPFPPGEGFDSVLVTRKYGRHAFALQVEGDSMHDPHNPDSFPPGCYIVVDPDAAANNGSLVIVRTASGDATFKQLVIDGDRQYLKPWNPRYPIIELDEEAVVCGVVKEQVIHKTYT